MICRWPILPAAVLLVSLTYGRAARAVEFHFTVTADPRGQHSRFGNTLQAINALVGGPGAFHASPGDIDPIPQNRAQVDAYFGSDALWYPGVGNHEAETGADMLWLRNEYNNGNNGQRTPLKEFTNQDGPPSSEETNYTWDYGNAHFIQLNQYWNGFSDTGTSGDIVPALYDWLAADLAANTRPAVFVFGHEPAFPYNRHVGDSLDQHRANRDRFWQLLEDYQVMAFFCGHTHFYSTHQGDVNHNGNVWQVDVGNAGNAPAQQPFQTFVNVIVGDSDVTFETYNNSIGWRLHETWTQTIPLWSTSLAWDENGPGKWDQPRWVGDASQDVPDDMTHAEVKTDTVELAEDGWALTLTVSSGGLAIGSPAVLTVGEGVEIGTGAALDVAGRLDAQSLTTAGTTSIAGGATVSVSEGVDVATRATLDLAGTLNAQSLTTAGTNIITDGASLSVASSLTLESTLDLTAATLITTPQVTNVQVNNGAVLTLSQALAGAELNVAGSVQTAGAEVTALNVTHGGLLSTSADVTAEHVNLTGGTIHLADGADLNVATMLLTGGTLNTGAGHVVVGDHLKIGDSTTIDVAGATFQLNGSNLADPAGPGQLTLSGGRVTIREGLAAPGGAIALWKFEDQDPLPARDLSTAGNDHVGTLINASRETDDPDHPTALGFRGNGYLEAANTEDLQLGQPFTIAMWIKTSESGVALLGKGFGDLQWRPAEKALGIDDGGRVSFTGKYCGAMKGLTNVANDEWHHVVVTYATSDDQEIYVDGTKDTDPLIFPPYTGAPNSGAFFRLGWAETRKDSENRVYQEYDGLMDNVYVYDRSLSQAEVSDLYDYEVFGGGAASLPNVHVRVTGDSVLGFDAASGEAVLGNLSLDAGKKLEVRGAAVRFRDLIAGNGSSIQGDLSVAGTLSPGDSPGTLNVAGRLAMEADSTYQWELGASAADLVAVDGDLALIDGWTLRLADAGGTCAATEQFGLFTYTGSYTGLLSFGSDILDGSQVVGSGRWNWSGAEINVEDNRVYLTGLIVIPEPGTMALAAIALLGFLAHVWRKRRRG